MQTNAVHTALLLVLLLLPLGSRPRSAPQGSSSHPTQGGDPCPLDKELEHCEGLAHSSEWINVYPECEWLNIAADFNFSLLQHGIGFGEGDPLECVTCKPCKAKLDYTIEVGPGSSGPWWWSITGDGGTTSGVEFGTLLLSGSETLRTACCGFDPFQCSPPSVSIQLGETNVFGECEGYAVFTLYCDNC